MDREELDAAIHEIHCRDLFLLTRAKQQIMWRPVFDDLPEKEVVDELTESSRHQISPPASC